MIRGFQLCRTQEDAAAFLDTPEYIEYSTAVEQFLDGPTHPYVKSYAEDIDVIIGVLWLLAVVRLLPFGE